MQYSSRPEFSPKQHPYQLYQLAGVQEPNCGEQLKRACAIPLQWRTRARNPYVRMEESLDCSCSGYSRYTSEVSIYPVSEGSLVVQLQRLTLWQSTHGQWNLNVDSSLVDFSSSLAVAA